MQIKKFLGLSFMACSFLFGSGDASILDQIQIDETKINDPLEGRKNNSSTKIIISKEEIARFGDQSMGDVLKRLPGLSFTGPAGYVEDIRFRGADKGYTQILIDGEPIVDGKKDRQFQVSRLSAEMIERIEIIKQTTAEFNSDGIAGTINIILKNPPKEGKGDYSLRYGQSDGEPIKEVFVNYGNKYDRLSYTVGVNALERPLVKPKTKTETAYADNAGHAVTSIKTEDELEIRSNKEVSVIPKVIYDINDISKLTLSGYFIGGTEDKSQIKNSTEDTGSIGSVDKRIYTDTSEIKDRINHRLLTKYEVSPTSTEKYSVTVMLNKGGEEKDKTTYTRTTTVATGVSTIANAKEHEDITEFEKKIKTDGSFVLGETNFVKVGLERSLKDFDSFKTSNGIITSSPSDQLDMKENSWQAYVMDEYMLTSDHIFTPGVRLEQFTQESLYNGSSKEGDYQFVNPSLHYLWHINEEINLRASIAKKVKKPKFDEIYNGIKSGSGTFASPYEVGNLDLKPEQSLGYELGLERFLADKLGVISVNGYYRIIKDKAEERTTLQSDGFYYKNKINVGEAKLYGIEFDAQKDLKGIIDGLNLYGNLTFMHGLVIDNGVERKLKDVPEYTLNLGFDQKLPSLGMTVGAAYNRLGGFEAYESATKLKSEGYKTIVDVYALKKLHKNLDFRITAKNITEVEKYKQDTEFSATSGRITKIATEIEESKVQIFASLEGRF